MAIEIHQYADEFERKWEYFVTHSDNGTIFHLRKFLSYHPAGRFTDASLYFSRKGTLYAVYPAVIYQADEERIYYSHPGASYGGFVIGEKIGLEETFEMVELIIDRARKLDCSHIIITQTPSYYFKKYSSYIDFALHSHGFSHRKRELSSVLTLLKTPDEQYKKFPDELKRAVKKAEKSGLTVVKRREIGEYYDILENNLSMRHNVRPTHTKEELERLIALFPERITLYSAMQKNNMMGGIVSFACNKQVNLAFYIAHNHTYQQFRPVDLMIWKLIEDSISQGFTYLDFGTFTLNMEPNWGLCRFKEKFGSRGVFRDTFERKI